MRGVWHRNVDLNFQAKLLQKCQLSIPSAAQSTKRCTSTIHLRLYFLSVKWDCSSVLQKRSFIVKIQIFLLALLEYLHKFFLRNRYPGPHSGCWWLMSLHIPYWVLTKVRWFYSFLDVTMQGFAMWTCFLCSMPWKMQSNLSWLILY